MFFQLLGSPSKALLFVVCVLQFCVAQNVCLPRSVPTKNSPKAQEETSITKLSDVCPGLDHLFPASNQDAFGWRDYRESWQKNYPMVIFDAKTGHLYWEENGKLLPLDSRTFTPITFTTEKLQYAVCRAHFGATITPNITTAAVPDAGADVEDAAKAVETGTMRTQAMVDLAQHKAPQENCNDALDQIQKAKDAVDKLNAATKAFSASPASADLKTIQDSIGGLKTTVPASCNSMSDTDYNSAAMYNEALFQTQHAAARLYDTTTAFKSEFVDKTDERQDKMRQAYQDLVKIAPNTKALHDAVKAMVSNEGKCKLSEIPNIDLAIGKYNNTSVDAIALSLHDLNSSVMKDAQLLEDWYANGRVDTLQTFDKVTANSLTRIAFQVSNNAAAPTKPEKPDNGDAGNPANQAQQGQDQDKPQSLSILPGTNVGVGVTDDDAKAAAQSFPKLQEGTAEGAVAFIERHRVVHFSAGGGFMLVRARNITYPAQTLPTTILTTTTVSTAGSPAGSTTVAQTTGTSTYAFATSDGAFQKTAIAGLTWYPFGRDTFPVTKLGHHQPVNTGTYASHRPLGKFGIFIGTSVSSSDYATIAPAWEFTPGMQLFAGATLTSKTTLGSNVIACNGFGSSALTTNLTSTTTDSSGVVTTTTVNTVTTSSCSNASATLISGTSIPTQTSLRPAFTFGVIFNTNLLKYFSGLGK